VTKNTRKNTRTPHARALGLLLTSYVLLYVAYLSARSPWVYGAFQGTGSIDYLELSIHDLARYPVVNSPLGGTPAISTLLGAPAPVTLLLVAAALATLTYITRTGLFAIVGIAATWLSRQSVYDTANLLTGPAGEGRFSIYEDQLTMYLTSCWVIMFVSGLLAIQVTCIDRLKRAETGEEGLLDSIYAVQQSTVNRYSKVLKK